MNAIKQASVQIVKLLEAANATVQGACEAKRAAEARVAELEAVIRELHDQVDQALGDTDLDNDPLVEVMGAAWKAISEQTGVGPAPDQSDKGLPTDYATDRDAAVNDEEPG